MSFLSVTRSLVSYTNPTEAQFDTIRSELLAYFNATSMTEANLADGGMDMTTLSGAADDVSMKWTASVALIKYISASNTTQIENASGDIVFYNKASSTAVESLRLGSDGNVTLGSGGNLRACQNQGSLSVDTTWLLSRYIKPILTYVDSNIVTVSANSPNADETIVIMRDRLCEIVDRTMSLSATANGYDSGHSGAAVSGLEDGLTRTANQWYYVYAVLVQYGTDADGINAILVASETPPTQGNCSTLDTEYGASKWVYMGLIRNGYNDGSSTNIIVPFVYDGYGNLRFLTTTETGKGNGVRLASSSSSSDLTYTLSFGIGASDLPVVATRAVFTGYRSAYSFILDYVNVSSGEIHTQGTACADTDTLSSMVGAVHLVVPIINGYKVVVRVGSSSTTNKIMLAGLVDHYV